MTMKTRLDEALSRIVEACKKNEGKKSGRKRGRPQETPRDTTVEVSEPSEKPKSATDAHM